MSERLKIGVVGAGVIAQVMHLHYLRELNDRYEVVALCDISEDSASRNAEVYGIPQTYTSWQEMIDLSGIDAILILTNGSHAPIAIAAAQAGIHVLTEKPMCFSVAEGHEMIAAADRAGVVLMVAYVKRFDAAYARLAEELQSVEDLRLVRVTTFESPFQPYVSHLPLVRGTTPPPSDVLDRLMAESKAALSSAINSEDTFLLKAYHEVMLDSLIHELNLVRSVLGEPDSLDYVDIRPTGVTAMLRFGDVPCAINWIDLPGITRYRQEFSFIGSDRRLELAFPSPFLRNAPATLEVEGGVPGQTRTWHTDELASYESGFKRELIEFHECVTKGAPVRTTGLDGLRDIALCQAFIAGHVTRQPIASPTSVD